MYLLLPRPVRRANFLRLIIIVMLAIILVPPTIQNEGAVVTATLNTAIGVYPQKLKIGVYEAVHQVVGVVVGVVFAQLLRTKRMLIPG